MKKLIPSIAVLAALACAVLLSSNHDPSESVEPAAEEEETPSSSSVEVDPEAVIA